ncbi:MAG: hypothetical protein J6I64_03105, partial [Lachnospiraceae bacterium]|nr:hypothetical protein [Lachnospiraceae bacterium]
MGNHITLYGVQNNIQVVDLEQGIIQRKLTVDSIGSSAIAYTPDGSYLIFQDGSNCLKIYDWEKGVYTMEEAVPKSGNLTFTFYDEGQTLSARLYGDYYT